MTILAFQVREGNGTPLQYSCLENPMDGGLQSMGEESDTTERLHFHFSLSCIGAGNGNPLQCSCLENPRDGGSWWAAVYGVAQSRTWLKRLSSSSSSPFGYDLSKISYDYTVEVTNRFKGLDVIECQKNYGQRFINCTGGSDKDHLQEKEMQKGKMLVWGGLTNSWEKKRSEKQRRKGKI